MRNFILTSGGGYVIHKALRWSPTPIGINIYEKRIVRQVGYLQELNRDARSTKHKILFSGYPKQTSVAGKRGFEA
jgi:hypothetical protein